MTYDIDEDDSPVVAELERLFETLPDGTSYADPHQDLVRAKRHVRRKRLHAAASCVAAAAAITVATQLVPGHAPNQDMTRVAGPVAPKPSVRPKAGSTSRSDPELDAVDDWTSCTGDPQLEHAYTNFYWIGTGIRSALGARLDPTGKHLERPGTQVMCRVPDQSGQREVQSDLAWTSGSDRGDIAVTVANFDDPAISHCSGKDGCTPTSTGDDRLTWAELTRNGRAGVGVGESFGVRAKRQDGQYVAIEVDYAEDTNDSNVPIHVVKHFPFDSQDLLKVAADPRINLNREVPEHR